MKSRLVRERLLMYHSENMKAQNRFTLRVTQMSNAILRLK